MIVREHLSSEILFDNMMLVPLMFSVGETLANNRDTTLEKNYHYIKNFLSVHHLQSILVQVSLSNGNSVSVKIMTKWLAGEMNKAIFKDCK